MTFCGWCKSFKPNKSPNRLAGGWWIGDGKCTNPKQEDRFTVEGNSCEFAEDVRKEQAR